VGGRVVDEWAGEWVGEWVDGWAGQRAGRVDGWVGGVPERGACELVRGCNAHSGLLQKLYHPAWS
jgi:hypothetical protein